MSSLPSTQNHLEQPSPHSTGSELCIDISSIHPGCILGRSAEVQHLSNCHLFFQLSGKRSPGPYASRARIRILFVAHMIYERIIRPPDAPPSRVNNVGHPRRLEGHPSPRAPWPAQETATFKRTPALSGTYIALVEHVVRRIILFVSAYRSVLISQS